MFAASDRLKRQTILATTAALPRPLRVGARYRLLGELDRGKAERAQVFIVGHPKSGNTWLRTLISRAYQVKYRLPASVIIKSDELARLDPRVPRFCVTNAHLSYEAVVAEYFDAANPAPPYADHPMVLLVRHPCDIAVSWYIQFTKRVSPGKRELINASLANPVDHESIGLWDFVMHEELGLPALIEYLNRWERNAAAHPHSLVVRYEELRLQTAKTLAAVTSFIGESFTDAEIQEAVDFGSFDNMRQLETSGFFRHGGYSRRKHVDGQSTFKVRRGQVFGYRDDLDAEQLAQVDAMVESRLSPSLGYARGGPAEELAAAASAENA